MDNGFTMSSATTYVGARKGDNTLRFVEPEKGTTPLDSFGRPPFAKAPLTRTAEFAEEDTQAVRGRLTPEPEKGARKGDNTLRFVRPPHFR